MERPLAILMIIIRSFHFHMERPLAILMIIRSFHFPNRKPIAIIIIIIIIFLFSSSNFSFQMSEKVYDISLWNFIYDISHPKLVRSEIELTEPFSLTELSPTTQKTLCVLLLMNRKRYRSKTFCKMLGVWYRNFVTFWSKESDHFLYELSPL